MEFKQIPVDLIDADHDFNARTIGGVVNAHPHDVTPDGEFLYVNTDEELTASVAKHGILQNLLVAGPDKAGRYKLLAGFRRYGAALNVGLEKVPCQVMASAADHDARAVNLVENVSRRDLSTHDTAFGLLDLERRLHTAGQPCKAADLAKATGKTTGYCYQLMRAAKVMGMLKEAKDAWRTGKLTVEEVFGLSSSKTKEELRERWDALNAPADDAEVSADGEEAPKKKAPSKAKIRALFASLAHAESVKIAKAHFGTGEPYVSIEDEHRAVMAAVLRWVLGDLATNPVTIVEPEEEAEEEVEEPKARRGKRSNS